MNKYHYSGAKSNTFWRSIERVRDKKTHDALYDAALKIQEAEDRFYQLVIKLRPRGLPK